MAALRGRGIPLRVGLVAATLVLVACGLLASGIAVTTILRHDLTNRVDETLLEASRSWAQAPRRMPSPPIEGPNPARPPSDFYVRGVDPLNKGDRSGVALALAQLDDAGVTAISSRGAWRDVVEQFFDCVFLP